MEKQRVAILVGTKGRGSNMQALITASKNGRRSWVVALVVSPVLDSNAMTKAQEINVETIVLNHRDTDYSEQLVTVLVRKKIDFVCLAGLMTKLPLAVLEKFPGRVLNVHPSLLPKFGGKGMYGSHVHQAVLESGEIKSGCTVHVVTEEYDDGPILLQKECKVLQSDTVESLSSRILELEHQAFVEALDKLSSNYGN